MEILFFVEDPGAANFIFDIPQKVLDEGLTSQLFVSGYASEYLSKRNIAFMEIDQDQNADDILSEYSPKLIVVGTSQNPNSIGLDLIDNGKMMGIPTVGFIDTAADCELRFCGVSKNPNKHEPDWIIVPDEYTKSALVKLGFSSVKIIVIQNPSYVRVINLAEKYNKIGKTKLRRKLNLNSISKPIIVYIDEYFNTLDTRLYKTEEYFFTGRPGAETRNEVILGELLSSIEYNKIDAFLIVRLHPKSDKSEYSNFDHDIDKFSSFDDPLELIYCADIVVGITSMLLMEAILLGKDVISIIPREIELGWAPQDLWIHTDPIMDFEMLNKSILSNAQTKSRTENHKQIYNKNHSLTVEKFLMRVIKKNA